MEPTSLDDYYRYLMDLYGEDDFKLLLTEPEGRRFLTKDNPRLFALVYLDRHLQGRETGDDITFSEFHMDILEHAKQWPRRDNNPAESRDVYVAPRGAGKSTWLFLILPLWAAAHQHRMFAAAFANAGTQAQRHLSTFKHELERNELLRQDYPELCAPQRRLKGSTSADNQSMYMAESGFVFTATGIDSSSLGLKIGERRPDLIILDDIEPDASNYSALLKDKRLVTVLEAVLPLNVYARVVMAGTVSMPGSIIHDLVKKARGEETEMWVDDERFRSHWYPAIIENEDGEERSLWPEKWSMEYMNTVRHTRSFRSQMMNDPMAVDGQYWIDTDFKYTDPDRPPRYTSQLLSIDPAVTSNAKSDFTAMALIAYDKTRDVAVVRRTWNLKIPPGIQLRKAVMGILDDFPDTTAVLVETNQGGEVWKAILHDIPVRIIAVHQSQAKELRAEKLLNAYQHGKVLHEMRLPKLEEQMVSFPRGLHDDLVDAVGTGVEAIRPRPRKSTRGKVRAISYL